ncbi:Uu.00g119000.m01.CDS01 [Anthostomella pinea]|uniref:ER membrane protein complex subunit 1 n=1 Tax=Anthostomella pinea TaxID=933095 RepID=A0AAI8VH18_9PEZI|nr:Uu.00g119000.m01.CDS01 [Anthostomella pinea]
MHLPLQALSLSLLLALPATVRAVFKDEAGHIDYHHELLGVPQRETTFFHHPRPQEKASLLYTLSDLGVLGAVNPGNGAIVWRQLLSGNVTDGGGHLRAAADDTWLASAYGSSVHTWDAISGRSIWSLDFDGVVKDLEIMEMAAEDRKDVLALYEEEGVTVARRIHGTDGRVLWEHREVNKDLPLQVSTDVEKIFVVTLHGSLLSYSLKVIVLDPATGQKLDEISIGTKGEVQKAEDVMFVGANSASPIVAWTDNTLTKLKVNVLGTKNRQEFPLDADTVGVEVHAPHTVQSAPHFLVHSRTKSGSKADVFHVDLKSSAISKAYDLPLLENGSAFSTSSSAANVYFTRVTADEVIITSSSSHEILGRWPLLKTGTEEVGAVHAVSEVLKKDEATYAVRSAVVTDADDWSQIVNGDLTWTRPEGMSGAVAATWAEIPESEDLAKTLDAEAHSNPLAAYIHRVKRHIDDLQYLPDYLQSVPKRLLSSIVGSDTTASSHALSRDSFGFNKLIVLATKRGKLYGLDAGSHGRVVWSKNANETPSGKRWDVKAIHADDVKGFVTVRGADGEFIIVKSDTGKTVEAMPSGLFPPVDGAVVVDSDAGPWLLPIGRDGKFPEMQSSYAPKQTVVSRTGNEVKGVTFESKGEQAAEVLAWMFSPPAGQKIVSLAGRPNHDPIASIGRVLGDRSVKYKYLNPNTLVVAAIDEQAASLSVYLLDTVSGQVLTSSTYEGVDPNKDVTCAISENWFLCSFYGQYQLREGQEQNLKGYQLVISDLYDSELSDDRGALGDSVNFSSLEPNDLPTGPVLPSVVSKTFILSGPITSLAVSQTRQGIATRQVLAYMPESHSIIGLPRMLLEPRRPVGRDPTPVELEEGLSRYFPAIELDPRMVITHLRDVVGVREIITAPAILESTSLVFAYGVDVFGTRVAPSQAFDVLGKGFNKLALIGTVLALMAGVVALGPMVRKKQINLRWQAPITGGGVWAQQTLGKFFQQRQSPSQDECCQTAWSLLPGHESIATSQHAGLPELHCHRHIQLVHDGYLARAFCTLSPPPFGEGVSTK